MATTTSPRYNDQYATAPRTQTMTTDALLSEALQLEAAYAGSDWPHAESVRYSFIREELKNR